MPEPALTDPAAVAADSFVVFALDGHGYAVPLRLVAEVLRMVALTPLPGRQDWLRGMLNLRGRGVPVIDLRRRLGLAGREPDPDMAIVVIRDGGDDLGLIVDEVEEVLDLRIEPLRGDAPDTGRDPAISAVAHAGARSILILDPLGLLRS